MPKLNPRVDFVFKKLFGVAEHKDLLIDLIKLTKDSIEGRKTFDGIEKEWNAYYSKLDKVAIDYSEISFADGICGQ